jgi:phospholipase C
VRGGLELTLVNPGASAVTLRLTSPRHGRTTRVIRVPARRSVPVAWPTAQGWYDVRVTADGDPAFLRTLTGRVEDGRPGSCGQ